MCCSDERARDRGGAGQDDGVVPLPSGEGRVRALLQAAPRQAPAAQQVRLRRQREEYDLQTEGAPHHDIFVTLYYKWKAIKHYFVPI